jgi:hypothetical protein
LTGGTAGINLDSSVSLTANGGNVIVLSQGPISQVSAATGLSIKAAAVGTTTSSSGGWVELGAGTTKSSLALAVVKHPGTVPTVPLGGNVTIDNQNTGVVWSNLSNSGSVNLNAGGNASSLTVRGGAIVFDSNGAANTVQLQGVQIYVNAYKPIDFSVEEQTEMDLIVDTGEFTDLRFEP